MLRCGAIFFDCGATCPIWERHVDGRGQPRLFSFFLAIPHCFSPSTKQQTGRAIGGRLRVRLGVGSWRFFSEEQHGESGCGREAGRALGLGRNSRKPSYRGDLCFFVRKKRVMLLNVGRES